MDENPISLGVRSNLAFDVSGVAGGPTDPLKSRGGRRLGGAGAPAPLGDSGVPGERGLEPGDSGVPGERGVSAPAEGSA